MRLKASDWLVLASIQGSYRYKSPNHHGVVESLHDKGTETSHCFNGLNGLNGVLLLRSRAPGAPKHLANAVGPVGAAATAET